MRDCTYDHPKQTESASKDLDNLRAEDGVQHHTLWVCRQGQLCWAVRTRSRGAVQRLELSFRAQACAAGPQALLTRILTNSVELAASESAALLPTMPTLSLHRSAACASVVQPLTSQHPDASPLPSPPHPAAGVPAPQAGSRSPAGQVGPASDGACAQHSIAAGGRRE